LKRFARPFAAICIAIAFVSLVLLARNTAPLLVALLVAGVVAALLYFYRVPVRIAISAKLAEWRSDVRQLGLWLTLAFKRKRDAQATAAMAHQQAFLSGRIMSPMNLFAVAAFCVVGSLGAVGFEEWRIARLKRQMNAPCSTTELSLNRSGEFRTSRQSCAALGATLGVAVQWRDRARDIEALRVADHARIAADIEAAEIVERDRRARSAQSQARQRRRQNEAITAALGGPAPDLERSVCELAGANDCGPAGSGDGGADAAAGAVPDDAGGAAIVTNP
jgi:hypothetical protein